MSFRKYVLKKDANPVVLKNSAELPIIRNSLSPDLKNKLTHHGHSPKHPKKPPSSAKKTKSMIRAFTTSKKLHTKSFEKKPFRLSIFQSKTPKTLNYNARYFRNLALNDPNEDIDEINNIKTPSESKKSSGIESFNNIALEYESYINQTAKPEVNESFY